MNIIRLVCLLTVAWSGYGISFAQNVSLDLTQLDNLSFGISGPGLDDTLATDSVQTVSVTLNKNYFLYISEAETKVANVKFKVTGSGTITNVKWRIPGELGTSYVDMDTALYTLENTDTRLVLKPKPLTVDLRDIDVDKTYMLQLADSGLNNDGLNYFDLKTFQVFPGRYYLKFPSIDARVAIRLQMDGALSPLYCTKSEQTAGFEAMFTHYYETIDDTARMIGKNVTVDMSYSATQYARLQGLRDNGNVDENATRDFKLLPGRYDLKLKAVSDNHNMATVRFMVSNSTGLLHNATDWKDLEGNQTNGGFLALDPGIAYLAPYRIAIAQVLPPPVNPACPGPFATLHTQLDGGHYLARQGELWLKYDERYADTTDLNLRILDMQNQFVSLSGPILRRYGSNWLKLQLPSGTFSTGAYYVLEVRNAKGDLSMLRFRYE